MHRDELSFKLSISWLACYFVSLLAIGSLFGCGFTEKSTLALTPSTSPVPASFFGLTTLDFIDHPTPMRFGTTRSWDAQELDWSDANPAPGVYDFSALDSFIKFNQKHNSDIIYTFGRTPLWASSRPDAPTPYAPGECAPPTSITFWDNYVRAIVTHAAGQIKYWELWNEPQDPEFYCGDISTMVTMAQHASQIIRSIDPSALVLSPGVTGATGPAWLSSFLANGGSAYVDIIAFHGYWNTTAEDILNVTANYATVMRANHVSDKQLWDTEASWAGCSCQATPTMEQQSAFISKYYLLQWSQGISRFVWYAYDGGPIWGGMEANGIESPAAASFKQTYIWLVGASLIEPCSSDHADTWSCTLSRPGNYTAIVLWNSTSTVSFDVPGQYTEYRDLTGAVYRLVSNTLTITNRPILLESGPIPHP